jgi:WhiB family transcriptional regulator, redox-sensing transcriptional regulator
MQDVATKCQRACMKSSSPRDPREYETPQCVSFDSEIFFPKDIDEPDYVRSKAEEQQRLAKEICGTCVHKFECAEWGITKEIYGVWGGMTERERRKVRKGLGLKDKDTVSV